MRTLARGTASPASAMSADHLRDESSSNGLMSGGVSLRGALTPSNCSGSRRGNPPADLITGDDDDLDSAMSMIPAQTPSSSSTGSQWPTSLKPEVQSASPMQPWPLVRSPAAPDSGPTAPTPTTMTKLAPQGSWAKGAPRMAATTTAAHSTAHGSDHAKRVSKAPVTPTIPAPHNAKGHGSERAPGGTDDRSTSLRTQSLVSSVPRWDSSTAAPAPLASNMALARLSSQWDPQRFWNDMLGQFICACQKTFNTADELEDHVRGEEHSAGPFRCPGCLRLFKSITALVSHCESASVRCSISRSENYSRILNDLSAGVLDTDGYNRDGSIKYKARPFDPNSVQW
ncbi:hypothetical protein KEM52_000208 [Ascosphaera acerosa]|nr:hypothetical protein KEM52_000208 [Ascosphaera acerosa]